MRALFCFTVFASVWIGQSAHAAWNEKDFNDLTAAEKAEARELARTQKFASFRVCADPGNMPFSDLKQQGLDNKLADLIAKSLGTTVTYFWRPYNERGLTKQTFETKDCDILMDVPSDYDSALETTPIYKSTYVFATRSKDHLSFKGLADPRLRQLKIGVYELSALRQSLANHGIVKNVQVHEVSHDGDLVEEHQPWRQVKQVLDGQLDVAAVWGPFAGWLKAKGAPLDIQPTNLMDDIVPMEFEMSIGLRKTDAVTKYAIENALEVHKDEVRKILVDYGVPLVECADCVISGPIKAHGIYTRPIVSPEELARLRMESNEKTRKNLARWLKEGADVNEEFSAAVLASDDVRMKILLQKGADVNHRDLEGFPPIVTAVRLGSLPMTRLLLEQGAKVDAQDSDGWSPMLHAVMRNDVSLMVELKAHGADPNPKTPRGYTALSLALEEKKFDAAIALIGFGAKVDEAVSSSKVTPLMITASEVPQQNRAKKLLQEKDSIDAARQLIKAGADVNKTSADGVTALMIAAAHDNAPAVGLLLQHGASLKIKSNTGETAEDVARRNSSASALRLIQLLSKSSQ